MRRKKHALVVAFLVLILIVGASASAQTPSANNSRPAGVVALPILEREIGVWQKRRAESWA